MCLFGGYYVAVFVDEDDVAAYTIKAIDDPRTLNKTVYVRPPENILSQRQIIEMWEKLTGKKLDKSSISAEEFLVSMKGNQEIMAWILFWIHYYKDGVSISLLSSSIV